MSNPISDNGTAGVPAAVEPGTMAVTPAPAGQSPAAGAPQTPSPSSSHHHAPMLSLSPTRPPYIPQFTAATEMILKRMRHESGSLTAALSAPLTAGRPVIQASTYEDVKRRLVMGMSTSMSATATATASASPALTMQMPPAPIVALPAMDGNERMESMAAQLKVMSAVRSAGRKVSIGLKTPISRTALSKITGGAESKAAAKKLVAKSPAKTGTKRKRGKAAQDDETSSLSSVGELSDQEASKENGGGGATPAPAPPTTTTKSGRQVLKPTTYNPAAVDAASAGRRRAHYGKRTAEQALCRRCSRMHSPASNQMVFCDGCNEGWHQMCHEPWIEDEIVRDRGREWFCGSCQAKRDRHFGGNKKRKDATVAGGGTGRVSWVGKTMQQKRAHLSTLPPSELVALLMHSLELHPDLPIFPSDSGSSAGLDGPLARADASPNGPINVSRKISNGKGGSGAHNHPQSQPDSREGSPLREAWPRPGMGLYSRLPPEEEDGEHLVDDNDFEAFSVIVYDEKGRKIEENGMKV